MDAATLVTRFPRLWHMAEDGSWPSIQSKGLLSTSSLLNLYKISGAERSAIEARHRPQSVPIDYKGLPRAVVRDQKPMSDAAVPASQQHVILLAFDRPTIQAAER